MSLDRFLDENGRYVVDEEMRDYIRQQSDPEYPRHQRRPSECKTMLRLEDCKVEIICVREQSHADLHTGFHPVSHALVSW